MIAGRAQAELEVTWTGAASQTTPESLRRTEFLLATCPVSPNASPLKDAHTRYI